MNQQTLQNLLAIALAVSILLNTALAVTVVDIEKPDPDPDLEYDDIFATDMGTGPDLDELSNNTVTIYKTSEAGSSQGSGFVTEDGYIITNAHVTNGTSEVYLEFTGHEFISGTVVGTDEYTDLSVIRPETLPDYAGGLEFTDSVEVGEQVTVMGSPGGYEQTVTTGVVSGKNRSASSIVQEYNIPAMIQIDAALNPGNSGGPVVNSDTEVVGVAQSTQGENLGFAISYELTEFVTDSLIENGTHDHPYLGIKTTEVPPSISEELDNVQPYDGVLLVETVEGGPSEGAFEPYQVGENGEGFAERGDRIVEIAGEDIHTNNDLSRELLLNYQAGDTVTLTVVHSDGSTEDITIELGDRPAV
jgi:S1-C subfamily serine protease